MKKTIAKTAAMVMAVMLAGAACMPAAVTAFAYTSSTTSDNSQVEMKEALTIVKKRVAIPKEVSEFKYTTSESYGTKSFNFTWTTPNGASEYRQIRVSITGGIITSYSDSQNSSSYSSNPKLAKLTEKQLLEKAKGYIKQLNPDIVNDVKLEIGSLSLFSNTATVSFKRYENGILVSGNNGSVTLDKNTGTLKSFSVNWWENAEFADPKGAKSEAEIQEAYKKLCNLTPYYKISTEWKKDENTGKYTSNQVVKIVYDPDFTSEIDAFTGKESTIWEDMSNAEGTRYYGNGWGNAVTEEEEECADEAGADDSIEFTKEELEKIEQDNNLIKTDKAFELLKKDKYAALTDDYTLKSYNIYSEKNEKTGEETFCLYLNYTVKDDLEKKYKGYKVINVEINAETGEVLYLNKYSNNSDLPKLNVSKANAIADAVTKTYAKDIVKEYKADSGNTAPVKSWEYDSKTVYEDSRMFTYSRYVNGIQVWGERINVSVDSNGVVTNYSTNHTEDVTFPSANILSESEAFDKLFTQQDFDYYYDGWITKDGKVKTYLIYKMNGFYLNAKTGKLCNWNGSDKTAYVSARDVKYSDIKDIPQEEAIKALQKYGIALTNDSRFKPDEIITEEDFANLLTNALGGYEVAIDEDVEEAYADASLDKGTDKKDDNEGDKKHIETTMREAAKMFGQLYLPSDVAKMKIFKSPFSDVKNSDDDAGYLAVANAKGFITGTDGKLNGDKTITRAEAVQIIYDYLVMLSK